MIDQVHTIFLLFVSLEFALIGMALVVGVLFILSMMMGPDRWSEPVTVMNMSRATDGEKVVMST